VVFLSFTPYFADKYLSSNNKMIKVYPEQQPIIFDLASNYCWGTSPKIAEDAKKILRLVLKNDFPPESICAALKPNRWDNLHSDVNQWEFSAPITRIIGAENINLRNQLVQGWMSMIMQSPFDWVQVRFMYLGWTLITSNSFIPQSRDKYNNFYGKDINFILWNLFYIPVTVFDKMRFLSLGFSLFFFLFILIRVRGFPKSEKRSRLSYNISSAILCLILTTAITMVGFVASNGRYVLPYIIVTHFLILKEYISIRNYK
jgi:hypothetical protein